MDKRLLLPILAILVPITSHSADISGFVRKAGSKPVPDAKVVYICNGKSFSGRTNGYGRYRIRGLPNVVWCKVTVNNVEVASRINSGSGSKEVDLRL